MLTRPARLRRRATTEHYKTIHHDTGCHVILFSLPFPCVQHGRAIREEESRMHLKSSYHIQNHRRQRSTEGEKTHSKIGEEKDVCNKLSPKNQFVYTKRLGWFSFLLSFCMLRGGASDWLQGVRSDRTWNGNVYLQVLFVMHVRSRRRY